MGLSLVLLFTTVRSIFRNAIEFILIQYKGTSLIKKYLSISNKMTEQIKNDY